ncbi:MAG: MBL fold metallo-hydrolase [Thermoanaerobaculia bacterium]|nr:MBL fold metallo-hydrolase [Thermoanaerobaculia bacterium]
MGLFVIDSFEVGQFACNCSIVGDPGTKEAIVVDPGDEPDRILEALAGSGFHPVALVHTHAHFDHVGCSGLLKRITGAPILMHEGDRPLYQNLAEQGAAFGLKFEAPSMVDRLLVQGDRVACGKDQLEVLHTPGHTPGSLCFRMACEDGDVLFSGDTLFRRSIGRTDLWGGSTPQILESIKERLLTLPGALRVIPGHGPETTIAEEGRRNPFVGDPNYRPL